METKIKRQMAAPSRTGKTLATGSFYPSPQGRHPIFFPTCRKKPSVLRKERANKERQIEAFLSSLSPGVTGKEKMPEAPEPGRCSRRLCIGGEGTNLLFSHPLPEKVSHSF